MTKLFKKYSELLNQSMLTEQDIIYLKARIGPNPRSLENNEVNKLTCRVLYGQCEYNITDDHAQKGIDYLRLKCFKQNGKPRKTKQVENMPRQFFEAIKDYSHFTFVGFTELNYNIYSNNSFYMPVWRIHTKSGQYFDYYMSEGLTFEHLEHNIESKLNLVTSEV